MIAKAKAVAHGIRAMLYVSGESRNKKHPERIIRICDNFMPQGMDATGIFYGNEVCHDEPSEHQEQYHSHGDKPGDGAYRKLHFG